MVQKKTITQNSGIFYNALAFKVSGGGGILGYHDENCMKKANSIGNCPAEKFRDFREI